MSDMKTVGQFVDTGNLCDLQRTFLPITGERTADVVSQFAEIIRGKSRIQEFAQIVTVLLFAGYHHVIYMDGHDHDYLILSHESEYARVSGALFETVLL